MSDELDKLEAAVTGKDENYFIDLTLNKTNSERIKLRDDYKAKFGRDLLEDFEKNFKSDFLETLIGVFKSPAEYDADLLYKAMKGIGSDKDIITEVLCFRNPERINQIKEKFQEKYGKDLVAEIKSETSGDYQKIVLKLLEGDRTQDGKADVEKCSGIADELYKAGEGKIGTDESIFIKYFTSLSPNELLIVCKEYHKKYKKNMLDVIENEFGGNEKKLLTVMLYALFSPSEFFAKQIMESIKGIGTDDVKLIRSVITRYSIDMKKVKKYFKKMYNKELLDEVKDDVNGSYGRILEALINKHD
jgi:annexin A7/11